MSEDELKKYELKRLIKFLKSCRAVDGHSTTLITIAIPPGTPVAEISSLVSRELATARNIKSRTTRKHVIEALQSIANRIKQWREFPPNGLVIYSGVTDKGKVYLEVEPPKPVPIRLYRCDSQFITDFLEEMLEERERYGILLVERDAATFGVLDGSRVIKLKHIEADVPSKHSKGGQSARRFERQIEQAYDEFLKKVADIANQLFLRENIRGLIVGGPGFAKEDLLKRGYLDYRLRQKIIGIVATQYLDEEGLREAAERARELISESKYARERAAWDELMEAANRNPELIAAGWSEVANALMHGVAEKVLCVDDLEGAVVKLTFEGSEYEERIELVPHDQLDERKRRWLDLCTRRGGQGSFEVLSDDVIEWLIKRCKEVGAELILVDSGSEVGEMLKKTFPPGIAAKLRWAFKVAG